MKRFLKWAGVIVAIPIGLLLVFMLILYIPPVQDFAVRKATEYASESTGWYITIERLRLSIVADLELQGLMVTDADGDTLVAAHEAVVDLSFKHILRRRIGVEGISLQEVHLNTKDMIATAVIKGRLQQLSLHDDINLGSQFVDVSDMAAHGLDLSIALQDTTVVDTTESAPLEWIIALKTARIDDARILFTMPGDSAMTSRAQVTALIVTDTKLDLGKQLYTVGNAELQAERAALWLTGDATGTRPMRADSLTLTAKCIAFDGEKMHLALPELALSMPQSKITAAVDMDLQALEPGKEGQMDISVSTTISKDDLLRAIGDFMPTNVAAAYPDIPLHLTLAATGNIDHLRLTRAEAALPGSIYADARGDMKDLMDSLNLMGRVDFNVHTKDLRWVRIMADGAMDGVLLPPMKLQGTATVKGPLYTARAVLSEAGGLVNMRGSVDMRDALSYEAALHTHHFQLQHFMPELAVGPLTATVTAKGRGTDIFDSATRMEAEAYVDQLTYDSLQFDGTKMEAQLINSKGSARLNVSNPALVAQVDMSTLLTRNRQYENGLCDITFGLDLSRADLHALGLLQEPVKTSLCLHMDGRTNFKDNHHMTGTINDIIVMHKDSVFRPEDLSTEILLAADTTYANAYSGDLTFRLGGHTGYEQLGIQLGHFMDELNNQMQHRFFDEEALTHRLPRVDLRCRFGQKNIVHDIMSAIGYDCEEVRFGMNLDPVKGINGGGHVYMMKVEGIQLDTIRAHIYQDSTSVRLDARVRNGRRNPQFTFDSRLNASLDSEGVASAHLLYLDERGKKGIDLGLQGKIANDTLFLHLDPLSPIIAYRTFHLNANNYVMLSKGNHIDADIDLLADDGTGLKLYTSPNREALQDISLSINRFNLGELSSVVPYMPRIGGFLHGDAHLIHKDGAMSVSTDLNVDNLKYEQASLGQVGLEAVYLPNADGTHFVDGNIVQMGVPVASFTGTYTPDDADGIIDVDATLDRLPFELANGFIPDGMVRMEGVAIGDIHISGSTSEPMVNGDIATSGLRILSDLYSLQLRVADNKIQIRDSQLNLSNILIYSTGANPFTMDGYINFADLSRITVNANMAAKDFELINSKKTTKSIAYGKVFVDFNAMMRGTIEDLSIYGQLNILGNTDVTYILTDSPLTTTDQLAELVEFVDFNDSLYVTSTETRKPLNLNVTFNINIAEAASAHCLLSNDGSSYVNLEGGGDLLMTYSPDKDLQLNGRYTINRGTLRYTMMVIPLKEFTIKSGSYAEFRGPLMNPALSFSATERMRTTVTENEQPRSVNFDVGMKISQTLQNLGLEFTLEAPDDSNIQNELNTMSAEQRGRLAVTMLATGMYINDAGALTNGGFTGQNALNAFLQSQISNISNKALKSVDLSMGVEQGTSATGETTTDYSFRFAKRLWGNRVSIIVGGKVSTGEKNEKSNESIIDNVGIEYRLDKGGSRYVNVFYNKNYESLLDGDITEMGAGLVLRKKTTNLGELFLFKKSDK